MSNHTGSSITRNEPEALMVPLYQNTRTNSHEISARNLSMPLERDNILNTGSPSSISQSDDPRLLENGVVEEISYLRPPDSNDPPPLERVVIKGESDQQQIPRSSDWLEFKPGYENGLLAIVVKTAETLLYQRDSLLRLDSEAGDYIWAKNVIDVVYRHRGSIPQLSTDVSHPYLKEIASFLNEYRHILCCDIREEYIDWSKDPMSKLNASHHYLVEERVSHRSNGPNKWHYLASQIYDKYSRYVPGFLLPKLVYSSPTEGSKATSKIISSVFPLLASLEVTICDFGDSRYERFQTTLDSAPQCKS